MVLWLPPADGTYLDTELDGEVHRSRARLNRILLDAGDTDAWQGLVGEYEEQSADWSAWADTRANYAEPLRVALARLPRAAMALEVGAGSDQSSIVDGDTADFTVTSDASLGMISRNPAPVRVACDVRRLPFTSGSLDLIFGLNAVPHVDEFARVLNKSGRVVWASSYGPRTPLYVAPEELAARFGSGWQVTAQKVAAGEWAVIERCVECRSS